MVYFIEIGFEEKVQIVQYIDDLKLDIELKVMNGFSNNMFSKNDWSNFTGSI